MGRYFDSKWKPEVSGCPATGLENIRFLRHGAQGMRSQSFSTPLVTILRQVDSVSAHCLANRTGPLFHSRLAGWTGITNNPPVGYHAIHIIVKNGHVTLEGAVAGHGDRNIANIQANTRAGYSFFSKSG